ncbi:hypothetical protein [Roseicyclus persicicus]|uniref:Uncharacterized protein n=1 Tax=Roseicyclus persicicus TaxID=2650661 RepID=A0A7X6K0C7_9RHOB|nr:hypothetical protein [Roseibacterium persicicum]NKX46469.1 hypothetical protein [Roseibacterium persicicum]
MRALLLALFLAAPARAEPVVLDPATVLALAAEPWRDRASFRDGLEAALGPLTVEMPRLPDGARDVDPFLWSLTGRFGAPLPGSRVAGGIFACSRYGVATRDTLAATALTDPAAFLLFGATQPAHDDATAWPEAGVARLACMITWDDTRRVAIIPEVAARAAVAARFATVTRSGDAELYGPGWRDYPPQFGADGYRIEGRDGAADSVLVLDRATIELRVSHQVIRFRAFLLNGGV